MSGPLHVLAIEPWFGGSHRRVLQGLSAYSTHEYRQITMPARHWKWRMQGAAVTLARKTRELVEGGYRPDVVLASSMLNLTAYIALTREVLSGVPVVLYMHENQLTYAMPHSEPPDYTYGFINYLSCLTADEIAFNSQYHLDRFVEALADLLTRLPDTVHRDSIEEILSRSSVLHLGIDVDALDRFARAASPGRDAGRPVAILWNHRWEYDKNPETFFRVIARLDEADLPFNLILLGEQFQSWPAEFDRARSLFADRILQFGYVHPLAEYAEWLHRGDVVVSTADQEFFGIAVLEAIRCGCHPLLPNRLSYPEIVSALFNRSGTPTGMLYDTEEELFALLASLIRGETSPLPREYLREVTDVFDWRRRAPHFDDLLQRASRHGVV